MTHYSNFKKHDPSLIPWMVEQWPFALLAVNHSKGPAIARAPLTPRAGSSEAGAVEFHLARANPVTDLLIAGDPVTIVIDGPNGPVSPSWYTARFPPPHADRSRTAPTWNYLSLTFSGTPVVLTENELYAQIRSLVSASEPANGWRMEEMDEDTFTSWCQEIVGFRVEVESFDLTAKLSQEQAAADISGVLEGLTLRGNPTDDSLGQLIAAELTGSLSQQ